MSSTKRTSRRNKSVVAKGQIQKGAPAPKKALEKPWWCRELDQPERKSNQERKELTRWMTVGTAGSSWLIGPAGRTRLGGAGWLAEQGSRSGPPPRGASRRGTGLAKKPKT